MAEIVKPVEIIEGQSVSSRLSRRRALGLGFGLAGTALLAACGGRPSRTPDKSGATAVPTSTPDKPSAVTKPLLPPDRRSERTGTFTSCEIVEAGDSPFSLHGGAHDQYLIKRRNGGPREVFSNQDVRGQTVFVGDEVCVEPEVAEVAPTPIPIPTSAPKPETKPRLPDLDDDAEDKPVRDGIGFSQLSPNHQKGWRWRGRTTCAPTSVANILERFGDTSSSATPYEINEEFLDNGIRDDIEANTMVRSGNNKQMDVLKWLEQKKHYKVEEVHDSYVGKNKRFSFDRAQKSLKENNLLLISGSVKWINAGTPDNFVPASHIMVMVDIDVEREVMMVLDPWDGLIHEKKLSDFATFDFSYAVKPMPKPRQWVPEIKWPNWAPNPKDYLPNLEDYLPEWAKKKAA